MAWTKHGHHIPGTVEADDRPALEAKCLGPKMCFICQADVLDYFETNVPFADGEFKDSFGMWDEREDLQFLAKRSVVSYVNHQMANGNTVSKIPINEREVHVIWFAETLASWKAMITTDLSDGMYYEVTLSHEKKELYFDAYKKIDNVVMRFD